MEDTLDLTLEALKRVGLEAVAGAAIDSSADLVIEPESAHVEVYLKRYSLIDTTRARRIRTGESGRAGDDEVLLMVVGDRVTAGAREDLMEHGVGFVDLRGQMGLKSERLIVRSSFDPMGQRAAATGAIAGRAGMEVAAAVLMLNEDEGVSVRQFARELDRSPSTVFGVLGRLREQHLTDANNAPLGTGLFWALAERWGETSRQRLLKVPESSDQTIGALGLGLVDPEHTVGWALTDTAAAAVYGAPVAAQADQVLDFLLPTVSTLRRAERLLGAPEHPGQARCTARVAPVRAACETRIDPKRNYYEWPLAHPLFVALDLAQDLGRGREILDAWEPPLRCRRVW